MSQQENRPDEEQGEQIQDAGQEPDYRPETQPMAGDGANTGDENPADEG